MDKKLLWILRLGLSATFIWVGVFVFKDPEAWGGYIQPWALKLLPVPIEEAMRGNALLDVAIGACLLINPLVWAAAALGALHLAMVLVVSGVNEGTVRDIGLLTVALCIAAETWPEKYKFWKR